MKGSKKLIAIILIAIVAALIFSFLAERNKEPGTTQSLRIGILPWIGNGVFYVAQEKGFFAKEGVSVEFVDVSDTTIGKQFLQTGKIDVLYLTPETVAVLMNAGVHVKVFAANDLSAGADGIVAEAGIQTVEDLKGKTVALEVGSPSHFLVSYLLNRRGLTTDDLKVVNNTAPDAGAAFVAGKVDAAVTWEPWLTQASQRAGGHLLASSKDVSLVYDMLIVRADVASTRIDDIKAILRASFEAEQWIDTYKTEAATIIAKPLKITEQEALEQMQGVHWLSYQENLDSFIEGTYSVKNSLQIAADLWIKLGLINTSIDVSTVVDDSLLRNLYQ